MTNDQLEDLVIVQQEVLKSAIAQIDALMISLEFLSTCLPDTYDETRAVIEKHMPQIRERWGL